MKNAKQGSALLIVLGFLSFMVVSAVAFSIYMRSERLPSSAMRRAVTTRHLVKAALARAIGDIDDALRAEPFPGCLGANGPKIQNAQSGKWDRYRDERRASWVGRVFMPLAWMDTDGNETEIQNRNSGSSGDLYSIPVASLDKDSVSTMTLEGLGYVPTPLVNEARLVGRRSWSSAWHYFDYDAGRYAYTALNVSDYLDINRLNAHTNRNSGGAGRISLSCFFEDASGKVSPTKAENFDTFVNETRGGQFGQYPFVSMLDFSLALRNNLSDSLANPFYQRLNDKTVEFYGQTWMDADGANRANVLQALMTDTEYLKNARPVFLTDSWFGPTNTAYRTDFCDLSHVQWQPFRGGENDVDPLSFVNDPSSFLNEFRAEFSIPAIFALYDYLDEDSQPSSLFMPCFERTPMICGFTLPRLSSVPQLLLKKESVTDKSDPNNPTTTDKYYVGFNIPDMDVLVSLAYPFKRKKPGETTSYSVQAYARVFFASAATSGRTSGFGAIDWPTYENSGRLAQLDTTPNSILLISDPSSFNVPSSVENEDDADCGNILVHLPGFNRAANLQVMEVVTQAGQQQAPTVMQNFQFLDNNYAVIAAPNPNVQIVPQMSLVLRVKGPDGTVDLVPAHITDDRLVDPSFDVHRNAPMLDTYLPATVPLIKFATTFSGGQTFALDPSSLQTLLSGQSGTDVAIPTENWPAEQYVCCDPRYNWAPEDWVKQAQSGDLYQSWLDLAHALLGVDDAHDVDVFMDVANEGYLQSVYEFMFLPRVCDWQEGHGDCGPWGLFTGLDIGRYNGAARTTAGDLANASLMWRSFRPAALGGEDVFEKIGQNKRGIQNGATGFRINPYTDNPMIFRTAIANTPFDWWAAGTNDTTSSRSSAFKNENLQNGLKYTFGPSSDFTADRWTKEKVNEVSEALRAALGSGATTEAWKTAFDAKWRESFVNDNENQLFGVDMGSATLHGVDRKFLYGFWRDCFACSQQLFLIFVRAESTALGGVGEGRSPGQLGGRAVALVWRDPKEPPQSWGPNDDRLDLPEAMVNGEQSTSDTRTPHKTRILFYHQFD